MDRGHTVDFGPDATAARKARFRRDGFVVVPGFLAGAQVAALRERIAHYVETTVPTLDDDVYYEDIRDPATLKQLQRLHVHDAKLGDLLRAGALPRLVADLMCEAVIGQNVQLFRKAAGAGKATPPHQDGHYFMITPGHGATAWLALDATDVGRGALRYVIGSHRRPLRPHARTDVLGFSQGITDFGPQDVSREHIVVAEPGDLVVHHAGTIHRADATTGAAPGRDALGFIYYAASVREDRDAHRAYQARLRTDLLRAGRLKSPAS